MKTFLSRTLLLLALPGAFWQTGLAQTQLSGRVTDAGGQPLPAASVLLLRKADTVLVKGQISDVTGAYRFEDLAPGEYRLGVSMLGYTDYRSEPFELQADKPAKILGVVVLNENAAQLGEVDIVAKKPLFEQKIDRMVVNVANSITNAGGTALEVLQRSPGVMVNRQTRSIALSGKSGVIIMINGKINRMPADAVVQLLEGMSADNIERIELIHTPPANFDAEGNAGIINIILKKTGDEGLNGGYSIHGGYGRRAKYGAGLNFNYRQKKLNLYGNYDLKYDKNLQVFTNYRGVENNGVLSETDTYSDRDPNLYTQNARLGLDYQLSPKTVLGVMGTFFDRYWDMRAVNDVEYRENGVVTGRLLMPNDEINHWNSWAGNVNLSHQFAPGHTLSADADYVFYKIDNPTNYATQLFGPDNTLLSETAFRIRKETPITLGVGKIDYARNFGKNTQFETGVKATVSRFDNDVKLDRRDQENWTPDPDLTSRFKLREDVAAAYATVSFKAGPKTDLKVGMRYEHTSTNLGSKEQPDVVDRQYGSWFPSVFVSQKLNEKQNLNFAYTRRIMRPAFTQLAPWLIFYDPSTLEGGNPALQPAFSDAFKVDYGFFRNWQLSVEFSVEDQSIRDVPAIDPVKNTQFNRPENIDNSRVLFASLYFPVHVKSWWEMQNQAFFVYQEANLHIDNQKLRISGPIGGLNSTQSFSLPLHFSIEVSGNYWTPSYWGITKWKGFGLLSCGVQKEFGARWGNLRFGVDDVLLSGNWSGNTNQPEVNLRTASAYRTAERTFKLTWSNKFGNNKLKSERQRATGAADEMRRF